VDPWFFVEAAPELTSLIYHARLVNGGQPHFVVETVKQALGSLAGKKIAALGLAYKPDVDDLRESPATEVVHLLQGEGARVKVWEPFKPDANVRGVEMATSLSAAVQDAEAILLLVRHTAFVNLSPEQLAASTQSRIIIDCVNAWNAEIWKEAGFSVFRLGVNKAEFVNQKP
jgi:UDP-N-acetyl-D-mannosaminuronic acid dehydrogenase